MPNIANLPSYQSARGELQEVAQAVSGVRADFITAEDRLKTLGPQPLTEQSLAEVVELIEIFREVATLDRSVIPAQPPGMSNILTAGYEYVYAWEVGTLLQAAWRCEAIVREGVARLRPKKPPKALMTRRRRRGRTGA